MNKERTDIFLKKISENSGIIHKVCNVYCNNSEHQEDVIERDDIPDLDEEINRLYRAIGKLNDVEKGIIMLYLEKNSYSEIGEIVGLSEKNISVRIVRIKAKLKKLMF